ncbi:MAG: ribosome-binding factor A, partial [Candidatus Sedimenticola sp. 6PFRAG1]
RHELGHRMRMRTIPVLHFVYDESIERGARLSSLIEQAVEEDSQHPEDQE